jgi:hypothetical protein
MARSLREIIESVVFAGLKPGAPHTAEKRMRWLGPLAGPMERFLSGGPTPSDPLYLSHRTPGQRIMLGVKVAIPLAIVGGGLFWYFRSGIQEKQPVLNLTPAEAAAKMMPDLNRVNVVTNKDIEVPEVGVDRSGSLALAGIVRNNTAHTVSAVEILFDVTDDRGSRLGNVSAQLQNLAPKSESKFRVPINQQTASIAIVRDIKMR